MIIRLIGIRVIEDERATQENNILRAEIPAARAARWLRCAMPRL